MKFSWKQDLRDKINIAKRVTRTTPDFIDEMAKLGVTVRNALNDRNEWVYEFASNSRLSAKGETLGKDYTRSAVCKYQERLRGYQFAEKDGERSSMKALKEAANRLYDIIEGRATEEEGRRIAMDKPLDVHTLAEVLRINDKYGISMYVEYEANILRARDWALTEKIMTGIEDNEFAIKARELEWAQAIARDYGIMMGVPKPKVDIDEILPGRNKPQRRLDADNTVDEKGKLRASKRKRNRSRNQDQGRNNTRGR